MNYDLTQIEAEYSAALAARTAARAKRTKALNAYLSARRADFKLHPGNYSAETIRLHEAAKKAAQEEADAEKHLGDVIKTAPAYTPEA